MKNCLNFLLIGLCLLFASCSRTEVEAEPDYDNMVMDDELDSEVLDEEKDRKVVVLDLPDPQELIILEPRAPQ